MSCEARFDVPLQESAQPTSSPNVDDMPVCLIVLGMAGSGKTTFVQSLTTYLHDKQSAPYVINLDPACKKVPYPANIDIRDTVKFKEIMKQYSLGPNGGIVTSLNLFATKFDQVLKFIENRKGKNEYVILDTPGQIEVFTWSASGSIITEALATSFPTIILYVIDTPRSSNPVTFMSNMLYACSILYKTHLPFIVVMNKVDVVSSDFAVEWMRDWEAFHGALSQETSYVSNLSSSMSLALDEFYNNLDTASVSAVTGEGMEKLMEAVRKATQDYHSEYRVEYEKLKKEKEASKKLEQEKQMNRVKNDMEEDGEPFVSSGTRYSAPTEAYITSSSMEQEETLDFDEAEEQKEKDSFQTFVKDHSAKQAAKIEAQSMQQENEAGSKT